MTVARVVSKGMDEQTSFATEVHAYRGNCDTALIASRSQWLLVMQLSKLRLHQVNKLMNAIAADPE